MKFAEKKTKRATFYIAGFIILSAIILSIGYQYYRYAVKSYRVLIEQELSVIADLKENEIVQWRKDRLGDVSVFYKNDVFSSLVQRYFEKPDDVETLKGIQIWLGNVQEHYDYERVFLMDANGVERLSIPSSSMPVASVISLRHSEIIKSKHIIFEDFYRNEHDNKIYLAVLTPIIDGLDSTRVLGILGLQVDPKHYLYPFISSWPAPSKTSETLILRREGDEVVFLNDLKFQKNAALNLRMPMNGTKAIPAIKAALGEEGIVEALDYRGVPVIAALRTISGSPWFMVARMDQAEAYAPLKERLSIIVILIGLLLIGVVAAFGFISKQQSIRFYRNKLDISAKLQASEEKFRLLFDTIPDAIFIHDLEGHFLQVNKSACERLGYSDVELLKMTVKDIDTTEFAEKYDECIKSFVEIGQGVLETEQIRRDGTIILIELSSCIIEFAGKLAVLSVARDITERKQKEELLMIESTALNAAANAIVITNITGEIKWINPAFTKLTGYTLDEVTGENPRTIKSGKHDAAFYMNLWDTILAGKVWQGEIINKRKDESEYTEEMTITPLKDVNGEIIRFIAIKQDISERKKFEEELSIAKAEAERANIAKSEFLSRMSHELRTPMNSILGFAQLMKMGELTPAHKKGVDHILKSGKHLLNLINEVLDLSRIEAGQLSISLEPVLVHGIITETLDIIHPLAIAQNITLEFPESTFNNFHVKADRQKLKQVLLNLISNAVKYNREGGEVKVTCEVGGTSTLRFRSVEPSLSDHGLKTVRISVIDTGKGIAPGEIQKLFNPFQRIGAEISEIEGTGLGLAVAKKLVEAMNGTIGVESEVGVGSTFWIELPQAEGQIDRHERNDDFRKSETASVVSGTLLYIEDNISNLHLVEQILEVHRPGIHLITETSGKNAVKLATDFAPDIILLDLDLPDIHGSEVLKLLQKDKITKSIPVVILSAYAMNSQIEKLMQAGARNYLTKPLDVMEFMRVVDEFLSRE